MKFTAYCLVYVLNHHYSGNKTQMAHGMRMKVEDFFSTFRRVVNEERESPTTLERLTHLCGENGIDMTAIYAAYNDDPNIKWEEPKPCPYYFVMKGLNERLSDLHEGIYTQQQRLRITKAANTLIEEIRDVCCDFGEVWDGSTLCHQYRLWKESGIMGNVADCPCQHISDMLNGLDDSSRN